MSLGPSNRYMPWAWTWRNSNHLEKNIKVLENKKKIKSWFSPAFSHFLQAPERFLLPIQTFLQLSYPSLLWVCSLLCPYLHPFRQYEKCSCHPTIPAFLPPPSILLTPPTGLPPHHHQATQTPHPPSSPTLPPYPWAHLKHASEPQALSCISEISLCHFWKCGGLAKRWFVLVGPASFEYWPVVESKTMKTAFKECKLHAYKFLSVPLLEFCLLTPLFFHWFVLYISPCIWHFENSSALLWIPRCNKVTRLSLSQFYINLIT